MRFERFHKTSYSIVLLTLGLFLLGCGGVKDESSVSPVNNLDTQPAASSMPVQPSNTVSATTIDPYQERRLNMVANGIESQGVTNADVLRAMRSVPRHLFVPDEFIDQAYENHPLPIGFGQTISQPYIVALMSELLELQPGEKVLEVGTGSGYQAAVLAELGKVEVFSIEIVPELAKSAAARLKESGYSNLHLKQADGYYGWPEEAPFDAIIVTAAPDHIPGPLAAQLTENGRLVIPIGPPGGFQILWKFVNQQGELKAYNMGGVAFVPLIGEGVKLGPAPTQP